MTDLELFLSGENPTPKPIQKTLEQTNVEVEEVPINNLTKGKTDLELFLSGSQAEEVVGLDNIFKEYGRKLVKKDIVGDPRLMDTVYSSLEARYKPASTLGTAYRGVTALSGGDTGGGAFGPRDYRKMDKDEAFEIWQNYQRSFVGGQSITTANEVGYGLQSNDDVKNKLGAGYLLFDQMDNAFTGAGTWSETGDAIRDYAKAGFVDPTTILTLGLGKVFSLGASKASGYAARSLMIKGYQEFIKKGMSKTAARKAVANTIVKAAPYSAAEMALNVGVDVAYQSQLMNVDVQEEYSAAQSAFAAAGSMIVPSIAVGTNLAKAFRKSSYMENTWIAHKEFDKNLLTLSKKEAYNELRKRVDKKSIIDSVTDNFGRVKGNSKEFLNWDEAKIDAKTGMLARGEKETDIELIDSFYKRFFFGDSSANKKGYYESLKDAGFVVHKSMLEDNTVTGVWGQSIKDFMTDEAAEKIMKSFEKSTGDKLGIAYTAEALGQNFISRTSTAGSIMWTPSQLSRLENSGIINVNDAMKSFGVKSKGEDKKRTQFALSVYKRLLTSHLSTTGANIKGFGQLVSINTAADFATAATNYGQGKFFSLIGDVDNAVKYNNRAWGSLVGAVRRGASAFSPELEFNYAKLILEQSPETITKLFRDVAGDGGVNDALKHFDLEGSKVAKGIDSVTRGAQTYTMVRMQDELTKTWSFGNNVNQAIMREYGELPETFFARSDAALEMATDKFKINVLEKATFRTLRETASVNWSTLPANNFLRSAATYIEKFTNKNLIGGFLVPFGSFLNTTLATAADLSGVNSMRYGLSELGRQTGKGYKKLRGTDKENILSEIKELDFVTQEGAEIFGKQVAGWTAISLAFVGFKPDDPNSERQKIKTGMSWNQIRRDDGSIADVAYDWPYSTIRLTGRILAHAQGESNNLKDFSWSEIPEDLLKELGNQLGGQAIRDLTDFEKSLSEYGQAIIEAASDSSKEGKVLNLTNKILGPPLSKVVQGASRPIDPINQFYGMLTDSNMLPDLKQGSANYNKSLKYVNHIFSKLSNVSEMQRKATPTKGTDRYTDQGKQILGVRSLPENSLFQYMLNSAGKAEWRAISFKGPAVIKNHMNALIAPALEEQSRKLLEQNPDFLERNTEQKEEIIKRIVQEAKKSVDKTMKLSELPRSLQMVRTLSQNKDKVQKVMDYLEIDGKLEDLLEEENGFEMLTKIDSLVKNYDQIFTGSLNLD